MVLKNYKIKKVLRIYEENGFFVNSRLEEQSYVLQKMRK